MWTYFTLTIDFFPSFSLRLRFFLSFPLSSLSLSHMVFLCSFYLERLMCVVCWVCVKIAIKVLSFEVFSPPKNVYKGFLCLWRADTIADNFKCKQNTHITANNKINTEDDDDKNVDYESKILERLPHKNNIIWK